MNDDKSIFIYNNGIKLSYTTSKTFENEYQFYIFAILKNGEVPEWSKGVVC